MQQTSALYREIISGPHRFETALTIGEQGRLMTRDGSPISFGGTTILIGSNGADNGFHEDVLRSVSTSISVFSGNTPSVGSCIAREIKVDMLLPAAEIVRQARIVPYVRATDGERYSEWIQKGVFWLDTREIVKSMNGNDRLVLTGYDDILKLEQTYPESRMGWPARDVDVVREIATYIGVDVDARTYEQMSLGYTVQYPGDMTCREALGYIAAMYGGNFIMSDIGELLLVCIGGIPAETRVLVDKTGMAITFGGVRIRV